MAENLAAYRARRDGLQRIGFLDRVTGAFSYDGSYLADARAAPISCSLPLQTEPYAGDRARPYFEGLLPEGEPRRLAAAALKVREDDYLALLAEYGRDCMGDVVIAPDADSMRTGQNYRELTGDDLVALFSDERGVAGAGAAARLSLTGTQSKTGLAHRPDKPMDCGWLRPLGTGASTHVLKANRRDDVSYLEYLCMRAADACGCEVARTDVLDFGRPVICSERFDRCACMGDRGLHVERLHQEDVAQAFGLGSGSKYAELERGTARRVASLLRDQTDEPVRNIEAFVRITCYNYLIGNCDNHLKNLSLLYDRDWFGKRLAPAYDLVCTTWFPDLSRDMGMAVGGMRDIDALRPEHLCAFAAEVGVPMSRLCAMCHELAERIVPAVFAAAAEAPCFADEIAWKAEDLIDDLAPRRAILLQV